MAELSTLGVVVKPTYEGQSDTNAFTDAEKSKLASLSSAYADLTGKPALDFIPLAQRATANGVAPLDAAGLVPLQHLNVSGLSFKGAWNPVANSPQLIDGTGSVGDFYKASAVGTANTGNGAFTYAVGDWIIYAGGTWQRLASTEAVATVNGKMGQVILTAADVGAKADSYVPTWAEVTSKPALVTSVNGQSGAVTVEGATWDTLPGKPTTFPATRRGSIGPAIPAVFARRSTNQSLGNGNFVNILYDVEIYDQFDMYDPATGYFLMPAWAKYARFTGRTNFAANGTGVRSTGIVLGAATSTFFIGGGFDTGTATSAVNGSIGITRQINSPIFPVSGGQTYKVQAYQNSGGSLDLIGAAGAVQQTVVQLELYE